MSHFLSRAISCVLVSLVFSFALNISEAAPQAPQTQPSFKAGFAERDITPDIGMEQPGGYSKVLHRIRHDPCKVRAVVFEEGDRRVALVGIDALIIRRPTVEAARKEIGAKCGIPAQAILIGASHSHSAGPTGMILPGEYDHASDLVKMLAYEKSSCADPKFLDRVEHAIVEAMVEANGRLVPARAAAGFGTEGSAIFNRRFRMKNGLTNTHPGQGNPDIVEPAGPIDPQVGVLGAWDADGKLLGCVVNYACHATTNPGGTSADYVCYIEQTVRGLFGEQAVVVFVAGAAGDVTQVDNRSPFQIKQSGEDNSRLVGGRVGAEAVKVLLSLKAGAGALRPLKFDSRTLQIHRRARAERSSRRICLASSGPRRSSSTARATTGRWTTIRRARKATDDSRSPSAATRTRPRTTANFPNFPRRRRRRAFRTRPRSPWT